MWTYILPLIFLILSTSASTICYECHANSTDTGRFCSIDKLCTGTSCYFDLKADKSWSAGCSNVLATAKNITCSASRSDYSCSCNTDFCNSLKKADEQLSTLTSKDSKSWFFISTKDTKTINSSLTLPNRTMIHCGECGTVTVNGSSVTIPCDHDHTCKGNYCVSVRGTAPYSYCGGVWDAEKKPSCTSIDDKPEVCVCSMHMCNLLLKPAELQTTPIPLSDPILATMATLPPLGDSPAANPVVVLIETTQKPTTKRKCKTGKFSPNDQAVFMGEKLKDVIMGGFGSEDGAVQNFQDDINDHICNYSSDDEEPTDKK